MQIEAMKINNFRAIRSADVTFSRLTSLIGGNNAGKSTILKAIELFFEAAPKITKEDFSAGSEGETIEFSITFNQLTPMDKAEFGDAIINERLVVSRHFSLDDKDSGQYSVTALAFSGFDEIRAETNGTKRLAAYRALQKIHDSLPAVTIGADIDPALIAWQKANPQKLKTQRIRGFFGAQNVAAGKLRKKTAVHVVSAVRDAGAETADAKRSPIISLMSDIAKQTFENKKEISVFLEKMKKEFELLADPDKIPQLASISSQLTDSIKRFYADSKLEAIWVKGQGVNVEYPAPRIVVDHGGVSSDLGRVGHGLQRAALFAIVQFLAEQRSANTIEEGQKEFDEAASDIIVLVEEPEIYQHPSKQTVIFDAFKGVTNGHNTSTGIRIQIIYTTHSEKFIRMPDIDSMRLVRRVQVEDKSENKVSSLSIETCSAAMAAFLDPAPKPMPNDSFIAKLHIFGREVCEGFFANKIILVEGITDRAILEAAYRVRGRDPNHESIAIISLDGKTKMDKPAYIFPEFGIPTFLVFDNDSKKKPDKQRTKMNILLQKICGVDVPEAMPSGCFQKYAALENDLESYLASQIGRDFEMLMQPIADEFGLSFDDVKKTPAATRLLFDRASQEGYSFPILDQIINSVDALG